MNQITEAMKKAGIGVPLNKRIWLWLKDHPDKTSKEIAAALNVSRNNVSPTLSDMDKRGMVSYKKQYLSYNAGKPGRTYINVYRALGDEFEVLPKPKKPKVQAVKPASEPKSLPAPAEKPMVERSLTSRRKISLDEMSVVEAKELYDQLKKIFG